MKELELLGDVDLRPLDDAQIASLQALEKLRKQIDETMQPLLRKCKTTGDLATLRTAMRNRMDCETFDGLIHVTFATTWATLPVDEQ